MKVVISDELKDIFSQILLEGKSDDEWAEIESGDMFQSEHYCGGYDAIERAFCFSFYAPDGNEFWFQVPLGDIRALLKDNVQEIDCRPAEW